MIKKLTFLSIIILIFAGCSDKTSKQNTPPSRRAYYPWKTVSFKELFSISCPDNWKVRRDKARLFLRPKEGYPLGIVIGVETSGYLNRLAPNKYFLHFYKNVVIPNKIKISGISDFKISGLNAITLGYSFKQGNNLVLKGKQYIIKHKRRFIFIVTEAPLNEYSKNSLNFKWIIESIRFSGVNYTQTQ